MQILITVAVLALVIGVVFLVGSRQPPDMDGRSLLE
jgi:hypothetical protein